MHSFPASVVVALAFSQQALSAVVGRNHTTPNHKRQEPKVTLDTFKDYYPDFAKEGNGPEPPLPGDDVALENVRGTRIFGGAGCDGGDWSMIKESWHDFNTIVATNGVKSDIDWNSQAAKEFWGPPGSIPQDRKDFIQKKYKNAEQMWSYYWAWEPPWLSWRRLYINVTCSGGDGGGDPENLCGDRKPDDNDGRCPPDRDGNPGPPIGKDQDKLQAYTTSEPPGEKYTKVTFCNAFFNLPTLSEAVDRAKKQSDSVKDNLETWDNRARVWVHEAMHMNYFMETDPKGKGPWVRDLTINLRGQGDVHPYGPYLARVLRNWNRNPGYYTQMNADTYAWFAMGKYAESQINSFPSKPKAGSKAPTRAPRDESNGSLNSIDPSIDQGEDNAPDPELKDVPEVEWQDQKDPGFKIPGCADRFMLGADPPLSPAGAQCPNYEASGVPKNVFSGEKGDLFAEFCKGIDTQKESSMTVDSEGKKIEKRAPPPDPDTWKGYKFTFNFKPDGKEACRKTCEEAYKAIQASSCGDREMPKTAYIDAGCGVYSYTIEIPKNQDDPPQNPPKQELVLGERECLSSGDKANDGFVPEYIGSACAGSSLPESNIKKDTKPPNQKFHTRTNDVTYTFNVYWKEGCETSVDEVNMFAPLPDSTDEINNCLSLMQDNHEKCKDKRQGGRIQAGCVVYEFKTEDNK